MVDKNESSYDFLKISQDKEILLLIRDGSFFT